jgi:hypothetical protein
MFGHKLKDNQICKPQKFHNIPITLICKLIQILDKFLKFKNLEYH